MATVDFLGIKIQHLEDLQPVGRAGRDSCSSWQEHSIGGNVQ